MFIKKKLFIIFCEGSFIYIDEYCLYMWGVELEEF